MRVSSINSVRYSNPNCRKPKMREAAPETAAQPTFEGKHTFAKGFAAYCGGSVATAAAVGLGIIMSGGLAAIPFALGAGAVAAAGGAAVGHQIDKEENKDNNKQK